MEVGPVAEVFQRPAHAYTLGSSVRVPAGHRRGETLANIPGAPPHLAALRAGLPLAPRCAFVHPMCPSGSSIPLR